MSSNPKPCLAVKSLILRGAAAGLLLAIAACSSNPRPAPRAVTILPSAAASLSPAIYMELVSNAALFAVRASELAEQRSRNEGILADARAVAADQRGIGSQLSLAGRRVDLLPRADLPAVMDADLAALAQSGDFDREYRRLVGQTLYRALEAHQIFARGGSSATLRPVAAMAAPVTKRNLARIRGR